MLLMMMMMCGGGSSVSGGGMNAAMTSLLSAMQGDGLSGLLSASGLSALRSAAFANPASGATGQAIVNQAMTRLGDPYSKSKRGTGNYVDCSYLAQWAYKQMGVDIPGTAAAQAKYCYENGYTISKDELQPGDLVFWTKHSSTAGRWRNIHHVGIYAGDGKLVEAKNNKNGVEVDDMWGQEGSGGDWEIVMYARPY
jgi:cell wall-associated NlpC family hydrolase